MIMKRECKIMLKRLEYPHWSLEDLMINYPELRDGYKEPEKKCYHGGHDKLSHSLFWYHCDCCGKRY